MHSDGLLRQVLEETHDTSWMLEYGDIVYIDRELSPCIVIRNGFADYERHVRVAGVRENLKDWAVGRWVRSDRCFKLEVGDKLVATVRSLTPLRTGGKSLLEHIAAIMDVLPMETFSLRLAVRSSRSSKKTLAGCLYSEPSVVLWLCLQGCTRECSAAISLEGLWLAQPLGSANF